MTRRARYVFCAAIALGWAQLAGAELTANEGTETAQVEEVRLNMEVMPVKLVPERGNIVVEQPGSAFLGWQPGLRLMTVSDQSLFRHFEVGKPVKVTVVAPKGAPVGTIVAAR